MAADAAVSGSRPPLCPSFAVVCSFLERYGAALDLPEMSFPQMETYLLDTTSVPRPLVELHVKLLRKLGKMVSVKRWEKNLIKICEELNSTWAWDLEQRGYQELSMECKTAILKYLCESQFDENLKFKMAVNEEEPERMRLEPIGRDQRGQLYWLQLDQENNIRMYTEEQDDLHGATWRCIVRSRKDLEAALKLLKAQSDPKLLHTDPPHSPALEEQHISSETQQNHSHRTGSIKEEPVTAEIQQKFPKAEQTSERRESDPPASAHHVRTITAVRTFQNTVSVLRAPASLSQETPTTLVRSSQATIPLKKRELKLSQDEHCQNHRNNSSSIIVRNPTVIHRPGPTCGLVSALSGSGPGPTCGLVSAVSGAELTNGKTRLNQVPAAFNHVGVICKLPSQQVSIQSSHSEQLRGQSSQSEQLRGPSAQEPQVVKTESVLVHKTEAQAVEINKLCVITKDLSKEVKIRVDSGVKDTTTEVGDKCVLEKTEERTQSGPDPKDLNGARAFDSLKAEASSELQREGIRLKIKIPPQHQGKVRGRGVKRKEVRTKEEEPRLRRSARISRPSSRAVESQRKRGGRKKGPVRPAVKTMRTKRRRGRPKWTNKKQNMKHVEQEQSTVKKEHEEQMQTEAELSAADACSRCGEASQPELILLCDLCDRGFHTACLRPPLMLVPDGEWFCPTCQHKQLCERLEEQLNSLDNALKRQEMADRRRERLVYVGISLENILPLRRGDKENVKKKEVRRSRSGRRSTRARKNISYRFDDFDDAINEAIEDNRDFSESHSSLLGSLSDEGIKIKSQPTTEQAVKRTEVQQPIGRQGSVVRKKRRLNDLESDSDTAADSEDEYLLSHSSEEEEDVLVAEDEADSELCSGDSLSLSGDRVGQRRRRHRVGRPRKKRRRRLEDSPDHLDCNSSSLSEGEGENAHRSLRRGLTQQVNYCESSSSDSGNTNQANTQRRRGRQRESSDYSDASMFSRDSDEDLCRNKEEEEHRRKGTRPRHRGPHSPPKPRPLS